MSTFTTLILRFRDLATRAGDTILDHKALCETNKEVWWGWWNKAGECLPVGTFVELNKRATASGGLELFLFDTGTESLYKVRCAEIHFSTKAERISSPDRNLTPAYYRDHPYLAWFRFTEMDDRPVDPKALQEFSYVDIPELFEEGESHYSAFHDKIVSSLKELRHQDRTVWFLRPASAKDSSHEILLVGAATTHPAHFPDRFITTPRVDLIWLSDLHFGEHAFPLTKTPDKMPLWLALETSCKNLGVEAAGILVSGDISWRAERSEFDAALEFFRELTGKMRLDLDLHRCLISPGNHDFSFDLERLRKGEQIETLSKLASGGFSRFYRSMFNVSPNNWCCSGRRFLLGNAIPVEIVALNSIVLQQTKDDFQGFGFVGEDQRDEVDKQMGWRRSGDQAEQRRDEGRLPLRRAKPYRIVMLHHHLVPVTLIESTEAKSRYSLTLDAEALIRWLLLRRIDLVLHGHMHQPSCIQLRRPVVLTPKIALTPSSWPSVTVCGLGSTGVTNAHQGKHGKNTFGVLSFGEGALRISTFNIDPQAATTQADLVYDVELERR